MFENFRRFLETVFRAPSPLWSFVSSPLEQQVANNLSSAFSNCSGLDAMLDSLDGRGQPKLSDKPQAIKRKRKLLVAKAKPKAKPKLQAAPKPKPELPPKSAASAAAAKPAAAPDAAPVAAQAKGLSNTRKCVHSRAYHAAAKAAKADGLNAAEISAAAKKAARAAAEQWDLDNA